MPRPAELLREQHPDTARIPFIVMSALADTAALSRGAGADAFLPKPFALADLVRAVAQLSQRGREQPRPQP